jgi:transposase
MVLTELLPGKGKLELDSCELISSKIVLAVHTTSLTAQCPACHTSSSYVHSSYLRRPADLSWAGFAVRLHWNVRRFKCSNPKCSKTTFAEQIPIIVAPYARRTTRLANLQCQIAYIAGGEPGSEVIAASAIPTSPDTLLRLIRKRPEENRPTPRVLGVDDWAKRKGQTYGIILVDLEKRCPVDLLEDRTSASLASWLKSHPGVEIISRDRGNEMIKGSTEGAPTALQVADRWHLLKNLHDALEHFLESKPACLKAAVETTPKELISQPVELITKQLVADEKHQTKAVQMQQFRQEKKSVRFEAVKTMQAEGFSQNEIVRQLKMAVKTVRKYALLETCPFYPQGCTRSSKMNPYRAYLEEKWQEGQQNATQLWREIQREGFSGSRGLVAQWAAKKRTHRLTKRESSRMPMPKRIVPLSPGRAVWLLLKSVDELDDEEQAALDRMIGMDAQVALAYTLGQAFLRMVRERQLDQLEG